MKVLQTIQGLSSRSGGPSTCTHDLMEGLYDVAPGMVDLFTLKCHDNTDHNLGEGTPWLKEASCDYKTPLVLSHNFKMFLEQSDYDLYHTNALWLYSNHITCKIAREKNKPYVVSPHGMLYPTALAIKRWKKIPMLKLWFNKDIMQATCLHATCVPEMEHCRAFGYKGPIAVIPNAVVFPEYLREFQVSSFKFQGNSNGRKTIGFLGRLHPIKKIEQVLYAMDILNKELINSSNSSSGSNSSFSVESTKMANPSGSKHETLKLKDILKFEIMGKGLDDYEQWLKEEVKRLGLEDCVEFVGFVSGKDKYDRLARLSALMVPSAQENFGMIVPEALICGTPVYASLGTPWSELNGYKLKDKNLELREQDLKHETLKPETAISDGSCGWWKDNEPETIAEVIKEILSLDDQQLLSKGRNGRKLMEEKYEQHKVAEMMKQLYEWIVNDNCDSNNKPEFVYL